MKQELLRLDAISQAIQKAASIDAAKDIRDKAEALRVYVKQSGQSLDVQNRCAEIKIRAERRAGEILSEMEKNKGARGKGVHFRDESAPTLADLGISQAQSHRWQKIASIPGRDFESFIGTVREGGKELTSVSMLRFASGLARESRTGKEPKESTHGVPPLWPDGKLFSTIVVDPPWEELGRRTHDLWNLPVPAICTRNAHLYLWVSNKTMEQGFEMLRMWGFRYLTCLTWCKSAADEASGIYHSTTEHILFAARGNPELMESEAGTWFQWPWGRIHSEKPDRFFEMVMRCSPGPYIVLFSSKQRPGWTTAKLDMKTVAALREWHSSSGHQGDRHMSGSEHHRHAS